MQLLLGASLPISLPLPVALLLRVSSFLVALLSLALAAREAPLSPLPGPVGPPPPFVRLLVGALLPVAPPLLVAPLLCVPSFDVVVVPLALPRLRPCYCLSPGLWALLRLVCAGSWALHCLELCCSRSLLGYTQRPSWLPRCLLLCVWVLLYPSSNCVCALCYLAPPCSRSLLCSVRHLSMLLCRLRLYCSRGSAVAYA